MFTFDATPVKWVGLLVLFTWCTVWCIHELTRPQDGRQRVSNIAHLVMAVVMLLMVAQPTWMGLTRIVPVWGLTALFAVLTGWFAWVTLAAFRSGRGGWHVAGHTTMFLAMTWHLAAMAVRREHRTAHGMDQEWMMQASRPGGILWVLALVGVPLMTYLLLASLANLRDAARPPAPVNDACACGPGCRCGAGCACSAHHPDAHLDALATDSAADALPHTGATTQGRGDTAVLTAPAAMAHTCHEERPVGTPRYRMAALSDFAMNFGMFWMSTGIMVPLLPFFALLAF